MATIISKNETETTECPLKGFTLATGEIVVFASQHQICELIKWLEVNGVHSLYFNPDSEPVEYSDFMVITISENIDAIQFYN